MSGTILVAGAINTDLVATMERAPDAGETITAHRFETFGGGKGANQAVSAARNQARTVILGARGNDANGRARIEDLARDHVDTTWVQLDDLHVSGVAMIFVEPGGENRIAYVPGATAAMPADHCLRCFDEVRPEILLATHELPTACLRSLFEAAAAKGTRVILNATPDPWLSRQLLPKVDILIVNEGEASVLLDTDRSEKLNEMSYRSLLAFGPSMVVVTLGGAGALLVTADSGHHVAAPQVEAIDTTGAGDSFCGAFAAALARGADPPRAVAYGVVAGSLATQKAGAQSSVPTLDAIEAAMQR